jgi:hypothetical protein
MASLALPRTVMVRGPSGVARRTTSENWDLAFPRVQIIGGSGWPFQIAIYGRGVQNRKHRNGGMFILSGRLRAIVLCLIMLLSMAAPLARADDVAGVAQANEMAMLQQGAPGVVVAGQSARVAAAIPLRRGPSAGAPILAFLPGGGEVWVKSVQAGFAQVEFRNSGRVMSGFVYVGALRMSGSPSPSFAARAQFAPARGAARVGFLKSAAEVRGQPSPAAPVSRRLYKGYEVTLDATSGEWAEIDFTYNRRVEHGYVLASALYMPGPREPAEALNAGDWAAAKAAEKDGDWQKARNLWERIDAQGAQPGAFDPDDPRRIDKRQIYYLVDAQISLGKMYLRGDGVARDYAKAPTAAIPA